MRRSAAWPLAMLLGAGFALGCDAIRVAQRGVLFQPEETGDAPADIAGLEGLERWWLDVEGGRVEAWYLPARGLAVGDRGGAIVFAHGNRERIEAWAPLLEPYRAMGLAVLLPEYRSYGRSGGVPSEAALVGDFEHFLVQLTDRPEIDPARIAFHGRSLGGGVVGALAARRLPAALILESTFTSVPDLASRWWIPMGAVTDRFDTREVLATSPTPALILHGVDDTLIPVRHAVELHRVAWDSELVTYRAGHDDLPRTEQGYWRRIRAFLVEAGVAFTRPGAAR